MWPRAGMSAGRAGSTVHGFAFPCGPFELTLCYLVRTAFDYNTRIIKSRRQVPQGDRTTSATKQKVPGSSCFVMLMRNAGVFQALNPFARALRIAMLPAFVVLDSRDPPFDQQGVRRGPLRLSVVICGTCAHWASIRVPSSPNTWLPGRICKTAAMIGRQAVGVLNPSLKS